MPATVKPLTDTEIRKAKPKDKEYKLSDGNGLFLLIRKSGNKMWRFDFSYGGKRKSMSFGTYPRVSLKEARESRERAKEQLLKNINPITYKNSQKLEEGINLNFIVSKWLDLRKLNSSPATVTQNERILKNVTSPLGNFALKDIKRVDIISALQVVQKKGNIETAHRLFSLLDKIFKFAVTNEYVERNIIGDIDKSSILVKNSENHLPAITEPNEIKELLKDINTIQEKFKTDISTALILKIVPYVFVRSANIRLMRWKELDLEKGIWTISKKNMKVSTNNDFIFPLPIQAIQILKNVEIYSKNRSEFVFPSPYKNDRGVAGATLSDTLNKLGYKNKHTFHGFRSMFSTVCNDNMKSHGFNSDIIEACLAHKDRNAVRRAYNRESKMKYFDEKKELIQWYANWLDILLIK